ncbi:MAG: DUF7405 family protein [Acidimicrobiales bacterium]
MADRIGERRPSRATADGTLSRRAFLGGAVASALAPSGAYGIIERLVPPGARLRPGQGTLAEPHGLPPEQYLFAGTRTVTDNGVVVDVPPLYHEVVTAKLAAATSASGLHEAQHALEAVLAGMEDDGLLTFTPQGLGLAIVWGLPYFDRFLPASLVARHMPLDVSGSALQGAYRPVLLPSVRFASDPKDTILENNDIAVVMASDSLPHLAAAYSAVFGGTLAGLFDVTSRRKGFVDATRLGRGGQSLTKRFALASKLPGAELIPDQSPLFLGFTSTQAAAQGQRGIANLESLGMTNQRAGSYFAGGTVLALSHLFEDLAEWYSRNAYADRVDVAFRPGLGSTVPPGTMTVAEGPGGAETERDVRSDIGAYGIVGHSGSMQPVSRLQQDTNGFGKGSAIPVRADFNTVDDPFAYSADPSRDQWSPYPSAGVHFLSYVPTSDYFTRLRSAMDGGLKSASPPYRAFVNSAGIATTHRQNFLVPPRAHRSFPLTELI